jgi:hypothetical protein
VTALNHTQRAHTHDDDNAYSPTHTLHPHDVPHSNQRGRATGVKDVQHRTTPYSTPHHPPTHTPAIEPAHGRVPNTSIAHSCPPPWPDPSTHHLPNKPPKHNPHASTALPPTTPTHGEIPTHASITRSRPPPWPDNTHNPHLPQSRPPPWPD